MINLSERQIVTAKGKALLAQVNAEEKALVIDKMILANVPDRPDYPQPDDTIPIEYVVHEAPVEARGRVSEDSVIYTTTLASTTGPFEFNWTGAYCSEYDVLVTIDHHATTPKTINQPGVAGNTLVRSIVLEYKDIAEITNINVEAESWQYENGKRLRRMEADSAQALVDMNGKDWFVEDGFAVSQDKDSGHYVVSPGIGYVSGNRVKLDYPRVLHVTEKPAFVYIDAYREGTPAGEWETKFNFVVVNDELDDYLDNTIYPAVPHYVCKLAEVSEDEIKDSRGVSGSILLSNQISQQLTDKTIFPVDPMVSIKAGDRIPDGVNCLRYKGQLWYAWDNIPSDSEVVSITNFTKLDNLEYRVAVLVTTSGEVELVSASVYAGRESSYASGWGFCPKIGVDNSLAWQACINRVNNQIIIDKKGIYEFHSQIVGKTQFTLTSLFEQEMNNRSVVFTSKRSWLGDGGTLLKAAPEQTQIQSFKIRKISFEGDTYSPWQELSKTEDKGIIAIDPSGIKQGFEVDGCVFANMKHTMKPVSGHGYLGHTKFTNNSVTGNRRVFDNIVSTTGLDITGSKFYDNYELGDINRVAGENVSFNNSSYSHEEAGLEFDTGIFGGILWLEGYNRFFRVKKFLKIDGGYLSECFSIVGAEKFSICPLNNNVAIELNGTRLGTNTRVFYFRHVDDLSTVCVEMKACYNGLHFSEASDITDALQKGLVFKGFANENPAWNVNITGSGLLPGANFQKNDGKKDYIPLLNRKVFWRESINFALDFSETIFGEPSSAQGHSLFEADIVGSNNQGGGDKAYLATVKIYNAFGDVWGVDVSGPDKDLYNITLSNKTNNSVDVNITETHDGSDDVLVIKSATPNGKIEFISED